jgi:SAM-dependent methyltransferase
MVATGISRCLTFLAESLLFPSYSARKRISFRYLRGTGLEIGALQHPLETSPGVIVRYVDHVSREENVRRYPHLDSARIVATDILDDGFALTAIPPESQDFVIANHLLEHAPNPLQTLVNWHRVLKENGTLFMTLPNGAKNFDRGRRITPLTHLVEDYQLVKNGDLELFAQRNREHYQEFVEISLPNLNRIRRRRPMTQERQREYLEQLIREQSTDPHFHLFTKESMVQLCTHLITLHAPDLLLQAIISSRLGHEYVIIMEKQRTT